PPGNLATAIRKPHYSHPETSLQPSGNLTTAIRKPRYSHPEISLLPPGNLTTATRKPHYSHPETSLQPSGNLTTAIRKPRYSHPETSLQPSGNLTTATRKPHYSHPEISLQPPGNLTTATRKSHYSHPETSLQPPGNLATAIRKPRYSHPETSLQPSGNLTTATRKSHSCHLEISLLPSGNLTPASRKSHSSHPEISLLPPGNLTPATRKSHSCHPETSLQPPGNLTPATWKPHSCHPEISLQPPGNLTPASRKSHSSHPEISLQPPGNLTPATWKSHSCLPEISLQPPGNLTPASRKSHSSHLEISLLPPGNHSPATRKSHSCHLEITLLPPGNLTPATRKPHYSHPEISLLPPGNHSPATRKSHSCHPETSLQPPGNLTPATWKSLSCHPEISLLPPGNLTTATRKSHSCHLETLLQPPGNLTPATWKPCYSHPEISLQPPGNLTPVTNYLFPIWTYSYLSVLPVVFLLTDLLRYKPVVVLQGLFLVSNYLLLCFARDLTAMTFLQFNYAVVTSTEVAYFSYIYSVIPPQCYQRATGFVRSAMLSGSTFGATLGQLLISLAGVSYFTVNVITLGLMGTAFVVSFLLPMPQHGVFFGPRPGASADPLEERSDATDARVSKVGWCSRESLGLAGRRMWANIKESYSSRRLVYWSLWWAFATAHYSQVFNYIQLIWNHIEPSSTSSVYNGGVEAVCTLVGAAAAFSVGYMRVRWEVWGEFSLGVFSAVGAVSVFFIGLSTNIWISYSGYVVFKASYMFLITITTFQIAANLSMECYALTFGINTFMAIAVQTVLTAVVVDDAALGLDIVTQFIIYGSCYGALSVLFLLRGLYTACTHHRRSRSAAGETTPHTLTPQTGGRETQSTKM
ncbi:hypothetical protein NFI96_030847, partial [Prochilodus magdalenae]